MTCLKIFKSAPVALIGLGLSASVFASVTYVAKKGDKLSKISGRAIPGPVWGENGSLKDILALNPEIKNPDLIYPGQTITLPLNQVAQAPSPSTPPRKNEPAPPEAKRIPASETPDSDDLNHNMFTSAGYHFETISAQDPTNSSSAKLFTSSDLEFSAGWSQSWDKTFSTFFEFGFEKVSFEPSNNPSKTLSGTSQSPAHFTLGADLRLTSFLALRTSAIYGQTLFTGTQGGGTIFIDSVFVPAFSEEIILSVLQKNRTSVGVMGGGTYLLGAAAGNYSVDSGHAVNGGLFIGQNFGHENQDTFSLLLGYENRVQNTSLVNQSVGDAFAKITFSMPIFGGTGK